MSGSLLVILFAALAADGVEMPRVLDDRLQLQLVASAPDVRTPTGIAVDAQGRVLVIESHTHFRPEKYDGPEHDRILMLADFGPDGKARKITPFFAGTKHTMNLAIHPDGSVYVATRAEIFRLRDVDQDGVAEERTPIAHLETKGDYPHNGLSGFAFDFAGDVYFGFGENLGADYKLIGSDGTSLTGGGEGGNIYCCNPAGGKLRRIATGFWNPFHLTFDAFGRLFAVDNDPDSRPPCRLLHIVEGGDYGFKFSNGRKGVHPFTAWNGELPGTLPMVAGTGEAPSGMLAYESDNLPPDYRGDLLVTSWGDHRLERYHLQPRGASFTAQLSPVVAGGENFRPVGLALAPDGSLFFSDWVDKSYQLHGQGRVWRLSAKNPPQPNRPTDVAAAIASPHGPWREAAAHKLDKPTAVKLAAESKDERVRSLAARAALADRPAYHDLASLVALHHPALWREFATEVATFPVVPPTDKELDSLRSLTKFDETITTALRKSLVSRDLESVPGPQSQYSDPFVYQAISESIVVDEQIRSHILTAKEIELFQALFTNNADPQLRAALCVGYRNANAANEKFLIPAMLKSPYAEVRQLGVIWVGEGKYTQFKAELTDCLEHRATSRQLFEACLAALDRLETKDPANSAKPESAGEEYVLRMLKDNRASAAIRRFAIRTLRPEHPQLTAELLTTLLKDPDEAIRIEAVRTLRQRADAERWPQLREIAQDEKLSSSERSEAILGLSPGNRADRAILLALAKGSDADVSDEALRALRGFDLTPKEKDDLTLLAENLAGPHRELAQRALERNPPKDLPKSEDLTAWLTRAEGEGDPEAGERVFFHLRVGGCFRCHEYEGRGYRVGPDLSTIGKSMTRERFIQSVIQPSREMGPLYTPWVILTGDGETLTGLYVGEEVDGTQQYADQNGRVHRIHPRDIERKKPSEQSIMPAGMGDNLTPQELRDLAAFMLQKK